MLFATLILLGAMQVLIAILFYLVVYALVTDSKLAWNIISNAARLSLSKKSKEEFIEVYHTLFNSSLKHLAAEIVQTKDKDLLEELEVDDIAKVKLFKEKLSDLLQDRDFEFMSYDEVEKSLREAHMFSFMNQIYINTNIYSNPQMLLLYKSIERYKKNELTEQKLYAEIQRTLKMSTNRAKQELTNLERMQTSNLLSILLMKLFSQRNTKDSRNEFQKMYNAIT